MGVKDKVSTETKTENETNTETNTETVAVKNTVIVIGNCAIGINGQLVTKGSVIELSDSDLDLQSYKSLFVTKNIEFLDDSKRTREFIESITVKPRAFQKPAEVIE